MGILNRVVMPLITILFAPTDEQTPTSGNGSGDVGIEVGLILMALIVMGGLWLFNKFNKVAGSSSNYFPTLNNTSSNWNQQHSMNEYEYGDDGDEEYGYDDEQDNDSGNYPYVDNAQSSNTNSNYWRRLPHLSTRPVPVTPTFVPNQNITPFPPNTIKSSLPLPPTQSLSLPPVTISLRERTIRALETIPLPSALPMPPRRVEYEIPFMYDGTRWLSIKLGRDGDWGVFGQKGGGKGNLLQHIVIHSLWMGPERVQMVVIDRKGGLDYSLCDEVAHARLYYNQQITEGLLYLIDQMEGRNELLRKSHSRNLEEYTRVTGIRLPLVVCILDEIADYDNKQKALVETLVRMARAAGFVIFLATQYPTADVLSSQIQVNVTNRVVFKLASSQNNWVALRRNTDGEGGLFDPSAIPLTRRGVGVCRLDTGEECLGQVPEVGDGWRRDTFQLIIARWPKVVDANAVVSTTSNVANDTFKNAPELDKKIANLTHRGSQSDLAVPGEVRESSGSLGEVREVREVRASLSTTDFVRIAMQIAAGQRTRTQIIKGMPGYQGPLYKEFAALYNEIEAEVKEAASGNKDAAV